MRNPARHAQLEAFAYSALYRYHSATKHTFNSLLNSRYSLDWANQPDPFRWYQGADSILLPRKIRAQSIGFFDLLERVESLNGSGRNALAAQVDASGIEATPLNLQFLSDLFFFSMSISAWKQVVDTDHRWALRVNPSSGNLHPTEVHVAVPSLPDLHTGIYHYKVLDHSLERRRAENPFNTSKSQRDEVPLVLCLTSILWRESWKYRQRAFRYCQHDLGHALCAISLSAAMLGWRAEVIGEFVDAELESLFGLADGDEKPMLLIVLRSARSERSGQLESLRIPIGVPDRRFAGVPNVLSATTITYDVIEEICKSTTREFLDPQAGQRREDVAASVREQAEMRSMFSDAAFYLNGKVLPLRDREREHGAHAESAGTVASTRESAQSLIRRRRSCLDLDGKQQMPFAHLSTILSSVTRGFSADFCGEDSFIHLFVYLHRIDGAEPGLYVYDSKMRSLVQLAAGDSREAAKTVSCFQDIAADGCFAVSMVADLLGAYRLFGDRGYRYVHYQAGYTGQLLYLTSLALGYESTGIGCFVDDEINAMLRLAEGFEVVYNFTIGRAVPDPRLTDLPAYEFLAGDDNY